VAAFPFTADCAGDPRCEVGRLVDEGADVRKEAARWRPAAAANRYATDRQRNARNETGSAAIIVEKTETPSFPRPGSLPVDETTVPAKGMP
jgi:hypothetical protein